MILISVALGGVCMLVAAVLAAISAGSIREHGRRFAATFGIILVVLLVAGRFLVLPHAVASFTMWRVGQQLSGNAVFAALKQYDAPTYRSIMSELDLTVREGRGEAEAMQGVRKIVEPMVMKRLPEASDEAASGYMKVMVQELTELKVKGDDLCFRFLYPQPGEPFDLHKHILPATRDADFKALSEVLRSAATAPQQSPLASEAQPLLDPVVAGLRERYGGDLGLLQNPNAPGVSRARICEITIALFDGIMKLPPAQSGLVVRHLLSKK